MAKTFNKVFAVSKETVYSTEVLALSQIASKNTAARILGKPELMSGTQAEYIVQRAVRNKAKDMPVSAGAGKTTTDELALLDSFSVETWESHSIQPGAQRAVGWKGKKRVKFEADSIGEVQAEFIASGVRVAAIERHQSLLKMVFDSIKGSAGTLSLTDIRLQLVKLAEAIRFAVDDFKLGGHPVIVINPLLTKHIEKELGTQWQHETTIYQTGLSTKYSIAGIPVVEDWHMNHFEKTGVTDRWAVLVVDVEALFFKADVTEDLIDQTLGLTRFVGRVFYDVQAIIDPTRLKGLLFDATAEVAAQKQVSE